MSEPLPCLLLVEDDPVIAAFLVQALAPMALAVEAANCAAQAISLVARRPPELLLLDLQLPDGDGPGLLAALRARGVDCPAVALTADADARVAGALADAGFAAVAHKPLTAAALRQLVAAWLPVPRPAAAVADAAPRPMGSGPLPVWDEDAALACAGGQAAVVAQLRTLLQRDLPGQCASLEASLAARDAAATDAVLHRLQAAAAFCGAARLADAARRLQRAVRDQQPHAADLHGLLEAASAVMGRTEPA